MRCRICHQDAIVLPPSRNLAESLLRPLVRFAYCSNCFTELTVRGNLLLGPRLVTLKPDEDHGTVSATQPSGSFANMSLDAIASELQRRLPADQLDELVKLLSSK